MKTKHKVAILGGGVGGVATAWALTEEPDWQDRYEITLYQMGWRLGGKGASGRNRAVHDRIEEHGLHVWLGFYDHAFAAMKKAYEALGRPAGAPLATWRDAFEKHSTVVLMEQVEGTWKPWTFEFPFNDDEPGTDTEPAPTEWAYALQTLRWLVDHLRSGALGLDLVEAAEVAALEGALTLALGLDAEAEKHDVGHHRTLVRLLEEFAAWVGRHLEGELAADDDVRRALLLVSTGAAITRGMIADGVILRGFGAVSDVDFRDFLRRHGADEQTADSALVRGLYDLVFAFVEGDPAQPNLNAGAALRSIFSMLFDYKGAIFWKMQAGMGDTVFVPFYEVLRRRGVRFELFHKVDNLGVGEDGKSIETLEFTRQVWLTGQQDDPAISYEPLVDVLGLPCWPSEPLLDQVDPEVAARLRDGDVDLESYFSRWEGVERRTLRRGDDYDTVVLAIPPGAHPFICRELIEQSAPFARMVTDVRTVQTQAMQLWLHRDITELGWRGPSPVLDAYADSLNTWADMTHLVAREAFPPSSNVRSIAYFCGPRPDAPDTPGPDDVTRGDTRWFSRRERADQAQSAIAWAAEHAAGLWPGVATAPERSGFDWSLLVAADDATGADRARAQYFRANYEPSERYVLSAAGSDASRLTADGSGFDNLVLAGDWTDNGFLNAGAVEPAVRSALKAAEAVARRVETTPER